MSSSSSFSTSSSSSSASSSSSSSSFSLYHGQVYLPPVDRDYKQSNATTIQMAGASLTDTLMHNASTVFEGEVVDNDYPWDLLPQHINWANQPLEWNYTKREWALLGAFGEYWLLSLVRVPCFLAS